GWLVAWLQDERLMSTTDLFQTENTAVEFEGRSSGSGDFRMARGVDGRIALVWQDASESLVDLWYAAFDPALQVWGLPQLLTNSASVEYAVSPVFDASGDLVAAFNRAPLVHEPRIVTLPSGPVEVQVPVPAEVDLYVLRRII